MKDDRLQEKIHDNNLVTITFVAHLLGVSVVTVRRRCRDGMLRFVKVNRALRFRMQDVDEYVELHCTPRIVHPSKPVSSPAADRTARAQ